MSRFHKYDTPQAVAAYVDRLNNSNPERQQIMDHIAAQIAAQGKENAVVLELCCGAGLLAWTLLDTHPNLQYVGVDFNPPFLNAARERLNSWPERVTLLCADLNRDAWPQQLIDDGAPEDVDAIVSMQSLHDLGGEPEVANVYARAQRLLRPGGLFLNADFIVAQGEELPNNPGRRSVPRHLELLTQHGYTNATCSLETEGFGVVQGFAP